MKCAFKYVGVNVVSLLIMGCITNDWVGTKFNFKIPRFINHIII